jgi:hypothetical protein
MSDENSVNEATGNVDQTAASEISRRDAVQVLAALPFAAIFTWPVAEQERARRFVDEALRSATEGVPYAPKFFTPAEFRTARILADMIIPRDERSGSASDAGVLEFMDFTLIDRPEQQAWMREGLAWLDAQSTTRVAKPFADATVAQREQILNDIAWPQRAPGTLTAGVRFFNNFRDMTASGFWSSRIGVQDLQYQGNKFMPEWNGCPPAALRKLGVSYEKFDRGKLRLTPG